MTTKWATRAVVGLVLLFGGCDQAPVELGTPGAAGAAGGLAGAGGQADLASAADAANARKDAEKQAAFEAWLRAAWPTPAR